jgi:hypothetical protein
MLVFNINRVSYDKEWRPVKSNNRFDFEKTIYLDMFLEKNKEKAKRLKEEASQLKIDLQKLRNAKAKYQADEKAEILMKAYKILNTMSSTEEDVAQSIMVSGSEFEFREPDKIGPALAGISKKELEVSQLALIKIFEAHSKEIKRIETKIRELEK